MRSNRPYVQLAPEVIEQARQMDLLSYLQRYEPDNLKHVARNVYCTREHDSLKISNLLDFLFHAIKPLVWTEMSPIFFILPAWNVTMGLEWVHF